MKIFDGRGFAKEKTFLVRQKVDAWTQRRRRRPYLATILNPNFPAGVVYTRVKSEIAGLVGVDFDRHEVMDPARARELVERFNGDENVDGVMVQLPLTNKGEKNMDREICNLISPNKDVDGLTDNSKYAPAVVEAVREILEKVVLEDWKEPNTDMVDKTIMIVGNKGFVGRKMHYFLSGWCRARMMGMDKDDFDAEKIKDADIVIAATGQPGLITGDMVKKDVVAIDVAYPKGDFDFESVSKRASFITPVPGGVGPVTVVMLFENLVSEV